MAKKITREEEALIPAFQGRREALRWFRDKYGDDFEMVSTEHYGDEICNFCVLILNRPEYEISKKALEHGHLVNGMKFLKTFQQIEIYKGGRIHIVH